MVGAKTRMAFGLVLIVALLAAHTATAARTIDAGSKEEAVLPVVTVGEDLINTGARALMGKDDGGKKGPPPIVCKKTPGPKGTNLVCN